ncbi:MAG: hypothetical protein AB1758_18105 [Candidatus Eremiobacterota bacterium]
MARRTGRSREEVTRLVRAWRECGAAGLEALFPTRCVEEPLLRFYARSVLEWLQREVPQVEWRLRAGGNCIRIEGGPTAHELRFAPDHCRWLLTRRVGRRWKVVPVNSGGCLTDLLRAVRRDGSPA